VNVAVTVDTPLGDETVPATGSLSSEAVLEAVRPVVVSGIGVTPLTQTGRLAREEVVVIAAMGLVAGLTVFRNGRMFKCERTSFFRMTFVTKVRDRIGPYHLGSKPAMRRVTIGAFNFALPDGMVRLFVHLAPHTFVTCQAQIGLTHFESVDGTLVDGVAIDAGDVISLVSPRIEQGDFFGVLMTGETDPRFLLRGLPLAKGH
jgi:hypothetical protein